MAKLTWPTRTDHAVSQSAVKAPAAVSRPGRMILAALLKRYPTLQTIDDICDDDDVELSDRTIRSELQTLIIDRLAERPKGKGKGATLTPTGKALAESLSTK